MEKRWDLSSDSSLAPSASSGGPGGESTRGAARFSGVIKIAAEGEVEELCHQGFELLEHYEVSYPEAFVATGKQLTMGYGSKASKIVLDHSFEVGVHGQCRAEIVKGRRFIMGRSADSLVAEMSSSLAQARSSLASALGDKATALAKMKELEARTEKLEGMRSADLARFQAKSSAYDILNDRAQIMERDLGRLREVLGTERFEEIVGRKKGRT